MRSYRGKAGGFLVGDAARQIRRLFKGRAIVADEKLGLDHIAAKGVGGRRTQYGRAHRYGFAKVILHPGAVVRALGDVSGGGQVRIQQRIALDRSGAGRDDWSWDRRRIGEAIGDHCNVRIVVGQGIGTRMAQNAADRRRDGLEGAGDAGRRGQDRRDRFAALNIRCAPDQLLHGVLGLHPGTAGFAPARRRGYGQLQPKLVSQFRRMFEGRLPFGRHIGEALLHHLGRCEAGVEIVQTAYADPLHPRQVKVDPLLSHIAVHPVPPDAGARGIGRIGEAVRQAVSMRENRQAKRRRRQQNSNDALGSGGACPGLKRHDENLSNRKERQEQNRWPAEGRPRACHRPRLSCPSARAEERRRRWPSPS